MGILDKVSSTPFFNSNTVFDSYIAGNNSVPTAALAGIAILLLLPADFPYQGIEIKRPKKTLSNLDITGAVLLVASLVLLITGLEQGASFLDWKRADVLGPLLASGPAWLLFFASQWRSSRPESKAEPLFPWRFLHNRPMIGMLLNCIFVSHSPTLLPTWVNASQVVAAGHVCFTLGPRTGPKELLGILERNQLLQDFLNLWTRPPPRVLEMLTEINTDGRCQRRMHLSAPAALSDGRRPVTTAVWTPSNPILCQRRLRYSSMRGGKQAKATTPPDPEYHRRSIPDHRSGLPVPEPRRRPGMDGPDGPAGVCRARLRRVYRDGDAALPFPRGPPGSRHGDRGHCPVPFSG